MINWRLIQNKVLGKPFISAIVMCKITKADLLISVRFVVLVFPSLRKLYVMSYFYTI